MMKRKLVLAACLSLFIVQLGLADCVTKRRTFAFDRFHRLEYSTRLFSQGKYLDAKAFVLDCLRNGHVLILEKGEKVKIMNHPLPHVPQVIEIEHKDKRWFTLIYDLNCR